MPKQPPFHSMFLLLLLALTACGASKKNQALPAEEIVNIPVFNADSAYCYTEKQTFFGPRVPNTKAHEDCKNYLVAFLQRTGATVTQQAANLKAYDGSILKSTNIVAAFQPEKTNRVLLCAHWDSRPWADNDPNPKNWHTPILGANDGASGVGVLMEIARQLSIETVKKNLPNVGVDIIFFDSEDYGTPEFYEGPDDEYSWCLGTQYWARNPHTPNYKANYGILLDMVGGAAPNFEWDYYSFKGAPQVLQKVWDKAASLGYNAMFKPTEGGAITDDHVYINKIAGIDCIDIIDFDSKNKTGFVPYWHTLDDTMKNIDKYSLKAVGETLLNVLYSE